jgi:hypothetical protein
MISEQMLGMDKKGGTNREEEEDDDEVLLEPCYLNQEKTTRYTMSRSLGFVE